MPWSGGGLPPLPQRVPRGVQGLQAYESQLLSSEETTECPGLEAPLPLGPIASHSACNGSEGPVFGYYVPVSVEPLHCPPLPSL